MAATAQNVTPSHRYKIPARPEAVIAIAELMKAKNPSASEIAKILKQDVFLIRAFWLL